MGERCLSESRYSSTDGYKCIAGKTQPTHPNYDLYGDDGAEEQLHEHMALYRKLTEILRSLMVLC